MHFLDEPRHRAWYSAADLSGVGQAEFPIDTRQSPTSPKGLPAAPSIRRQESLKRCFDVAAAGLLLVLLAPLLALIGVLVRMTSPGPSLYLARRTGRGGREFTLLKFRSMYVDASRRPGSIASDQNRIKIRNDPRVTRLGEVLRRYSLDELPQLVNVLRGDMSLVGPRPLPSCDLHSHATGRDLQLWRETRSEVWPGMTGLWQISGRSDLEFDRMVELDVAYVENWSLPQDFKILLRTPFAVLSGRGAY